MLGSPVATAAIAAVLAIAAGPGCKASIGQEEPATDGVDAGDDSVPDGQVLDAVLDAALDAAPDALRLCAGGEASAASPTTCFYRVATVSTWAAARASCETTAGASLAIIRTLADQSAAASLVPVEAFIGIHDQGAEGTFVWLDEPAPATPTFWSPNEPNNGGPNGEDCSIIVNARAGLWDDRPCAGVGGRYPFVCSYPL